MRPRLDAMEPSIRQVWDWLAEVADPEIPVISVVDLGIVREVTWDGDPSRECRVTVTPTYSGCPATDVIAHAIAGKLKERGVRHVRVDTRLAPAWTTDWLTEEAREKLRRYGIAPPAQRATATEHIVDLSLIRRRVDTSPPVTCPRCGSTHTERVSEFGSTPCKALYRCCACREPFDYFKCH
jgi:ring-1,2-phenylacetyl-CoA epoxidase subunit PaaD